MRKTRYLHDLPSKTHYLSIIMKKKKSHTPKLMDILQNTSPGTLKTGKVIKNKRSLKNHENLQESKEMWHLNVMRYPGRDLETDDGH